MTNTNTLIQLLPVIVPIISSFVGLFLTVIFTSLNHSKKIKYFRTRLEELEKENNQIHLDFKLYKEKMDHWAFDMKVDLKKALDENTLLIKKIEMYKNNSSVEYNKELEDKLNDYLKTSDELSNELLKVKNDKAELLHRIEIVTFENRKLKMKVGTLEQELDKQVSFMENVKKFEESIKNFNFSKKSEAPEKDDSIVDKETKPLAWNTSEIEKSV